MIVVQLFKHLRALSVLLSFTLTFIAHINNNYIPSLT
jgi:hypothetical protein